MEIRKITDEVPLVLPEAEGRSQGVHVSSIIRCIAEDTGILKPQWCEEAGLYDVRQITDPDAILRISIGLAWEAYYIPLLEGVIDHPGEYQTDGVYGTPDGESVSVIITLSGPQHVLVVHEVKATYKSTRTVGDLRSQWMWLSQMQAYCKQSGALHARMHVLFLCGDYSYPIRPMREVWELSFTQAEIDDNWELLTGYRDLKESERG